MTVERHSFLDTRTRYFLTAGSGDGRWKEVALDQARVAAGLGEVNIIKLSSKEFSLLEYLINHKNTIVTKDQIISHV